MFRPARTEHNSRGAWFSLLRVCNSNLSRKILSANPGDYGDDRAAWRSTQAFRSASAAVIATAVVFGIRFLTIPLSIRIAGPDGYGLWLTAGSLVAWVGLADLGFGSGLVHCVATACAVGDRNAAQRHVSTAMAVFALLALPLAGAVIWVSGHPAVSGALNLARKPWLAHEASLILLISGLAFVACFALNWVGPLCSALQEGYRTSIGSAAAGIVTVAALYLIRNQHVPLSQFALVNALPPLLATVCVALALVAGRHRTIAWPRFTLCNAASLRSIMGQGGPLFVVQLSDLAILNTANLFIAHFLGFAEVARYSVALALFSTAARICYVVASAYWPAYADASARNDWVWLRRVAKKNLALTAAVMLLAGTTFVMAGTSLIRWWAGPAAVPEVSLLAAMTFYFLASTCSATVGTLLNGLGLARVRAWLRLFVGAVHVAGGWLLMPHFGLTVIPIAGGIGFAVDFLVSALYARNHIRGAVRQPVVPQVYASESA